MKTNAVSLAMLLVPAALNAQAGPASAPLDFKAPSGFTMAGSSKLEIVYAEAQEHRVPLEPIARRVAEGVAKGASESAIIASANKVEMNLEATQQAMIAGGRMRPSDDELARGAAAMERGVTRAGIEGIALNTQGDRSLAVAFDVLARLATTLPVNQAVAQVRAGVSTGASDAAIMRSARP
jgi:hypothetical protein